MKFSATEEGSVPRLEWPEEAYGNEREAFYEALLGILGPADWIAVVPTPAPLGAVRAAIEADCKGVLQPLEMPYDGVAWLCPWSKLSQVLPCLFLARRPELAFLAFDKRPDVTEVTAALQSADAQPATRFLLFDDGELVEIKGNSIMR
ncbi:MAG TPA: hypothetical protein ENJ17_05310 [Gammaproteobacteria bacterium]|nr:hypothetical protein [Gammaproteobacteria bacterium]